MGRHQFSPQALNLLSQASNQPFQATNLPSQAISHLRTNESPPVFYRTLSPLWPLPCFPSLQFTIMQSRATDIADHILPLGDLLVACMRLYMFLCWSLCPSVLPSLH